MTTSRLREKRYIARRSGFSSVTTSMNWALPGAGPTTRIAWSPVSVIISQRIDDRRPHRHLAHVDVVVDRGRQVGAGEQPPLLAHLDGDRPRADAGQDLARQRIRHHPERRGIEHQRRGIGRGQPVVQPVGPEIGDRGHIDQHFRDHDQRNGQQQQLAGQPEPARRRGAASLRGRWSSVDVTHIAFNGLQHAARPRKGQITVR